MTQESGDITYVLKSLPINLPAWCGARGRVSEEILTGDKAWIFLFFIFWPYQIPLGVIVALHKVGDES